ncbi:MAG: hypothetical protein ACR2GY_04030 [Phycisphaerales bacterium]
MFPSDLSETDLLDLIESENAQEPEHAALRERLAQTPELSRAIECMRLDRQTLMADPDPQLCEDLVTALEPSLARPMLFDETPVSMRMQDAQSFRMRHRRTVHQRLARYSPVLLAAGVMLSLTAGMFLFYSAILNNDPNIDERAQQPSLADAGAFLPGAVVDRGELPPERTLLGPVHHWNVHMVPSQTLAAHDSGPNRAPVQAERQKPTLQLASGARAYELPFVLELPGANVDDFRAGAITILADVANAALVRNFTADEAAQAWERMARNSQADDPRNVFADARSGTGATRTRTIERDARNRMQHAAAELSLGEHLAGLPELAAPADVQFRLGESGLMYTITLKATDLPAFIVNLSTLAESPVWLRPLSTENAGTSASSDEHASGTWQSWQSWRTAVDAVAALDDPNGFVVIAVSVGR